MTAEDKKFSLGGLRFKVDYVGNVKGEEYWKVRIVRDRININSSEFEDLYKEFETAARYFSEKIFEERGNKTNIKDLVNKLKGRGSSVKNIIAGYFNKNKYFISEKFLALNQILEEMRWLLPKANEIEGCDKNSGKICKLFSEKMNDFPSEEKELFNHIMNVAVKLNKNSDINQEKIKSFYFMVAKNLGLGEFAPSGEPVNAQENISVIRGFLEAWGKIKSLAVTEETESPTEETGSLTEETESLTVTEETESLRNALCQKGLSMEAVANVFLSKDFMYKYITNQNKKKLSEGSIVVYQIGENRYDVLFNDRYDHKMKLGIFKFDITLSDIADEIKKMLPGDDDQVVANGDVYKVVPPAIHRSLTQSPTQKLEPKRKELRLTLLDGRSGVFAGHHEGAQMRMQLDGEPKRNSWFSIMDRNLTSDQRKEITDLFPDLVGYKVEKTA